MSRLRSMGRLTLAYGAHQVRRRLRRPGPHAQQLLDLYASDRLQPLLPAEREALPAIARCINCGLCALAGRGRLRGATVPDLPAAYLRGFQLLPLVRDDLSEGMTVDLEAAAAACPVGVPLAEVAAMVRRLSGASVL